MCSEQNSKFHPLITFSIIVPVCPDNVRPYGLDYLEKLRYPRDRIEVLLARGRQPSRQRNEAVRRAKGEVLVFFDDDSCPEPDFLQRLAPHYDDPSVAGVGGPNPGIPTDKYVPNLVEAVFTSRFAVLSKRSRYLPTGQLRPGSDSDFIFCNFSMRREVFLQMGGLDERLYPNEENLFFECFHQQFPDQKLLYNPELIAREPRPETMRLFLRKIFGYGWGRARQFKLRSSTWSFLHLLILVLLGLPIVIFFTLTPWPLISLFLLYGGMLVLDAGYWLIVRRKILIALGLPLATVATHLAYALGLVAGLFQSIKTKSPLDAKIILEYIELNPSERNRK
jgi:cellulose synthase/poly-beta-1,6-N-acetylglucosamine synthase-like glycosyltransferase